ncbi:MAG: undecaprenyl-phosphate glucose phosphotransferase [Planctomycetales bacterium]|nr:undecaprenyl-phosphate glucose phosphotransferase [Planctomycetales bacterium]
MSVRHRVITQRQSLRNATYRLLDAAAILLGLALAVNLVPDFDSKATIITCMAAIGVFSVVAEFTAMYRDWQAVSLRRELTCASATWFITLVVLAIVGRVSEYTTEITPGALSLWFLTTPVIAIVGRYLLRQINRLLIDRGLVGTGYAVVGVNELGIQLVHNINDSPEMGLKFMGFYDDRPAPRTSSLPDEMDRRLGKIQELVEHARSGKVAKVFITLPMRAEKRIRDVLEQLSDSTASVYVVPDFFVFELLHSRWTDIQGIPAVSIFENPFYGVDGILKRTFDVAAACAMLVLLSVPMALIALAVKLTSRGPAIFKQKRYGLDGKEILVWKFRSMRVCENGAKVTQATKNDSRLTPIGGFLRKSSLDELPQLINVLQGTMSLVGPRPHATAHNEEYRTKINGYMLRHKVKPGITGLAQVNGWRGETETLEKMKGRIECDHRYIREWSIWLDIKIMLRTVLVVMKRQNAY